MTSFGENFAISLEIDDGGKIVSLRDGAFKKLVQLSENFSSVLRVELTGEKYTSTTLDPNDQLLDTTNITVKLSTGIQKKVFSQNMELGVRKIELIQGLNMGHAVIRVSYNIARALKWQLHVPYEKVDGASNEIKLPQNINMVIQTDSLVKYEDDLLIFSIQEGFSQIVLFIISDVPYEQMGKNLLLLTLGDESKRDIINMAPPNEKVFPIISFVYLQDFKSDITRYEDLHQIGSILALRNRSEDAIKYLKDALTAVRAVGDSSKEAEILMSLATVESESGDFKQAAHDFNYALKIIEEYQFESLRLGCLPSLSKVLKRLNRFQEALDIQYMILDVMRENQDRLGEAEILVDISESLNGLGHLGEAIEYQQAALQLRRQMKDEIGEANNLMRFGEMLIAADRTGEAMGCYEQALRVKRNLGDDRGVAECLKKIGIAFYNRGKYVKAKEYFEKAKEAFQNQALMLEVKEIDDSLNRMREHPYPETGCDICRARCSPDIVGSAHADVTDPVFIGPFKQVLRESLASKNMDKVVDLLQETAMLNSDLESYGISQNAYSFCLMVQATNIHLSQLSEAQKKQMIQMVQDTIKTRQYRQM
ncbi:MAG: tetratricopeptide repeat protein [Candidatus Helarchaeota archaeon]|nr:tetratricopeptide repeat protein [Candidatus Helarchaeota archaeon]